MIPINQQGLSSGSSSIYFFFKNTVTLTIENIYAFLKMYQLFWKLNSEGETCVFSKYHQSIMF